MVERLLQTITIREMNLEDFPTVQEIDHLSFRLPWPENAFRYELLENPAALLWVAEVQTDAETHQVVGMVVVWRVADEAHIATLAVHPDYRGRGIAKQMLAHALLFSAQKGAYRARLEVRANNAVAIALYNSFGFKTVGRRKHYYCDNQEDALLMNLDKIDESILNRRINILYA